MSVQFSPYEVYFDDNGRPTGIGQQLFLRLNQLFAAQDAKVADLGTSGAGTLKGNAGGTSGATQDLDGATATSILSVFTDTAKGLVPASGGGTTTFLRADRSWAVVSSASGSFDLDDGTASGGGGFLLEDGGA